MMRVRLCFTKGPGVRFISHLDLLRTFERALRRAALPLALTQGYHPRPKLTFASALALGATSEAEYLDVELAAPVPLGEIVRRLNSVLPADIRVSAAGEVPAAAPPLMAIVDTALYELRPLRPLDEGQWERLGSVLAGLLREKSLLVERTTKSGTKQVNLRPLILQAEVSGDKIAMLVRSGSRGNVRPEELLALLGQEPTGWQVHRVGLFIAQDDRLRSPMEEAGVVVDGS
ncbi:MAG: DUF2344 domain-containing protein [Firmicutes bacterium]|nr:DUF2344 domain-containing protein [Bacillota bacterium]